MNTPILRLTLVLLTGLLLFGCTAQPGEPAGVDDPTTPPASATPQATPSPTGEQTPELPTRQAGSIKPQPTEEPIIEELPDEVMAAVLAALEQHLGSQPGEFKVIRSQAVTWNDGSLGCPEPGMFYTQATVAGYWVVIQIEDTMYDYRMGRIGSTPKLCDQR